MTDLAKEIYEMGVRMNRLFAEAMVIEGKEPFCGNSNRQEDENNTDSTDDGGNSDGTDRYQAR